MKKFFKCKTIHFAYLAYFLFFLLNAGAKDVLFIDDFVNKHYNPNLSSFTGRVFINSKNNFVSSEMSAFSFLMSRYTNLLTAPTDEAHNIIYINEFGSIEKAIDGFYKNFDHSNLVRIDSSTSCFFDLFGENSGDDKSAGLIIFDPSKPGYDEFRCLLNAFFIFYGFDEVIYSKNEEVSEELFQFILLSKSYACSRRGLNLRKECISESIKEIGLDLINE